MTSIQEGPGKSFPSIFPTKASLEGFYRFVNHERVSSSEILESAYNKTKTKLNDHQLVLAIHDTTAFEFRSSVPIEGMGRANKLLGQGFFVIFALE